MKATTALLILTLGLLPACANGTSRSASTVTPDAVSGVAFVIDRPILEGTDAVSGTGLPGAPLILLDVTFMGAELGRATIGTDGRFSIPVAPLEKGHRIGIILEDSAGSQWAPQDITSPRYFGPGAMQAPQIAFFYDTEMVVGE
jgi:hypothetical protein